MKIINYNTFINMPNGTMYSEYEPCVFGDIKIKHDTIFFDDGHGSDWYYQEFQSNPEYDCTPDDQFVDACEKMESNKSVRLDFYCIQRDGMYDYDRQFAIYEKQDIEDMINKLNEIKDVLE